MLTPSETRAREAHPRYLASRRDHVAALAAAMRDLSDDDKLRGLVVVHATGLMLPRGILRLGLCLVGLRGEARKAIFLAELYRRDPAGALTLWEQTCSHVLHGRDREDANSVGGWSQREIDLFLECFRPLPASLESQKEGAADRKVLSGQSVSLSPSEGQSANAAATGIERPTPTPGGLAEGERP